MEKGAYVPRFERATESDGAVGDEPRASTQGFTEELHELWGPFVNGAAPLLIAFDVRLFFYAPGTGLVLRD